MGQYSPGMEEAYPFATSNYTVLTDRFPETILPSPKKDTMKTILLFTIMIFLAGCNKPGDFSYLNTDRRPQVIIVSERYTDPPAANTNGTWIPYKIMRDSLSRDIGYQAYENVPPDTIWSSCSIDKLDSLFRIEIRKYFIIK